MYMYMFKYHVFNLWRSLENICRSTYFYIPINIHISVNNALKTIATPSLTFQSLTLTSENGTKIFRIYEENVKGNTYSYHGFWQVVTVQNFNTLFQFVSSRFNTGGQTPQILTES